MNSGSLRITEITTALAIAGHQVAFWAHSENDRRYRVKLEEQGVACFAGDPDPTDGSLAELQRFVFHANPEIAIFVHHDIFSNSISTIRSQFPNCHCILDTVDLHYVRERRASGLSGALSDREKADTCFREEWSALNKADSVWVVSEVEKEQLRTDGLEKGKDIFVIGNVHTAMLSTRPIARRNGIVFLGGYKHSPNVDAVDFFMEQVFPLLQAERPEIEFTIAGSYPPTSFEEYDSIPGVHVTGFVEDIRELLESHLVSVAPLRYGAGVKGKIGEYFCTGTPCVTTSIGAEGMGLVDGEDVLIIDSPVEFAAAILRLYKDEELWRHLSENGKHYVDRVLSPEAVKPALVNAVNGARNCQPVKVKLQRSYRLASLINPINLARSMRSVVQSLRSGGVGELCFRYRRWLWKD